MKLLYLFTALIACGAAVTASAEYPTMLMKMSDGTEHAISTSGLTINYSQGMMNATNTSGEILTLPLEQLISMEFNNTVSIDGATIANSDGSITVYTLDGTELGLYASAAHALNELPAGVYVIKNSSGITSKIIIR